MIERTKNQEQYMQIIIILIHNHESFGQKFTHDSFILAEVTKQSDIVVVTFCSTEIVAFGREVVIVSSWNNGISHE